MCEELSIEYEQQFIDILNDALSQYNQHNHSSDDIIDIITSYIFSNEYYFRRDGHFIDIKDQIITIYLYQSKFCKNLFKLRCPIHSGSFKEYCNIQSSIHQVNKISTWIDTECKEDQFSNSKAANMVNNSYFLMMTYFEESKQDTTPWLVQWKYDKDCMPFVQVHTKIVSYPTDWNYVTLSYNNDHLDIKWDISAVFYTSMEQHIIKFIPDKKNENDEFDVEYKENVSVMKFANHLNFPWLMFGSAATKVLNYNDMVLLFDNISNNPLLNDMNPLNKNNEYFVTRSCKDFVEMLDHGTFWTSKRDSISIIQITDKRNYKRKLYEIEEEKDKVDVNLSCHIPIFTSIDDDRFNYNLLDVTITNDWTNKFQRKYGIKYNYKSFMILYTEIRDDANTKTSQLYACYVNVQSGKAEILKRSKIASSHCLTKFLVGRGSYQTSRNDWMCTIIGVDENNSEIRHQLRLSESLDLLYYQRVKRNENVQEVTNRYKCKGLKYFKRALKEEMEMQRQIISQNNNDNIWWNSLFERRHLIISTLLGAYIGYRVSRAVRNGQWSFRSFRFGL